MQSSDFQQTIISHFSQNKRDFPWRATTNPYYIFLSEVMLQQTQTARVVSKYNEFIEAFPTIHDLANAPLSLVLAHWSGLGYNRRAKFLWQAAQAISQQYNGEFPQDFEKIDLLPGIGPYTARAIYTFSFNLPSVFIETNIRTVFIHFFFQDRDSIADSEILPLIEQTLPESDFRNWYYALMDYGNYLKSEQKSYFHKQKGYTKQSKFKGSKRYVRGYILKKLVQDQSLMISEIVLPGYEKDTIQTIIADLVKENLIVKKGKTLYLP